VAIGKAQKAKQSRQIISAVIVGVFALSVMGALGFYAMTKESIDSRFCPSTISGHTVILIDKTDKLGFTQQQALLTDVSDVIKNLKSGTLVSVFSLTADFESSATPIIQLCSPGRFETGDSELTKGKSFTEKTFKERFEEPVLQTVQELAAAAPDASSPILEMLQLVGIKGFKRAGIGSNLELVVYSDFLHNTKNFSMYRTSNKFDDFASSDYGIQVMPKLREVSVRLKYFMHTPKFQGQDNRKFWMQLFRQSGAGIESVETMEGR
jgi:hypothetical protein